MSDGLDDLFADTDSSTPGSDGKPKGSGLRAQLEQVLQERQALQEKLARLETAQRSRDLNELFTKHSVPELARDFFPADAELTDKAVTEFAERYGALWGRQAPTAETPPAEQAAAQAMAQVAGQAAPPSLAPLDEAGYRAKFSEAKSMAELRQMMTELGVLGA